MLLRCPSSPFSSQHRRDYIFGSEFRSQKTVKLAFPMEHRRGVSIDSGSSPLHTKKHISCCQASTKDHQSLSREGHSVHGLSDTIVGVLGGGQLGRMLCQAASQMAIKVMVLVPLENCPASAVSYRHVVGSFDDSATVENSAKRCGVLTVEIEHVDVATLEKLEQQGVICHPKASTILTIQF